MLENLQRIRMHPSVNKNTKLTKNTQFKRNLTAELALSILMFGPVPRFQT